MTTAADTNILLDVFIPTDTDSRDRRRPPPAGASGAALDSVAGLVRNALN